MTNFLTAVLGGGFIALVLALAWIILGIPEAMRWFNKEDLPVVSVFLFIFVMTLIVPATYAMGAFLLKLMAR